MSLCWTPLTSSLQLTRFIIIVCWSSLLSLNPTCFCLYWVLSLPPAICWIYLSNLFVSPGLVELNFWWKCTRRKYIFTFIFRATPTLQFLSLLRLQVCLVGVSRRRTYNEAAEQLHVQQVLESNLYFAPLGPQPPLSSSFIVDPPTTRSLHYNNHPFT